MDEIHGIAGNVDELLVELDDVEATMEQGTTYQTELAGVLNVVEDEISGRSGFEQQPATSEVVVGLNLGSISTLNLWG